MLQATLLCLANCLSTCDPPYTEELAVQDASLQKVTSLLKEAWPGANVELFGSVANGLSVRGTNDLDICMQLPESSDTKVRLRARMGRKLASMKPKLSGCLSCP